MELTLYDKFVEEMNKTGLRKVFANLEEKDVTLSDNDEVIYITIKDCQAISIKGIRESTIRGKLFVHPHYMSIKIYDYNYQEAKPEDAVQFSVAELKKSGLSSPEWPHIIYYHYPYRVASYKLKLKKGIVITKNKRLELRIMRNGSPLKIGKFELKIECDKWFKNDGG